MSMYNDDGERHPNLLVFSFRQQVSDEVLDAIKKLQNEHALWPYETCIHELLELGAERLKRKKRGKG